MCSSTNLSSSGRDSPAVRALEVGELDDRDRRALGALRRRVVDRDVLHLVGVEAVVDSSRSARASAVLDAAEDVFAAGQALVAVALLLDALRDRDRHVRARREELGDVRAPVLLFARSERARVDPVEGRRRASGLSPSWRPRRTTFRRSTRRRAKSPRIANVNALNAHASGRELTTEPAGRRGLREHVGGAGLGQRLCARGPHAARHIPPCAASSFASRHRGASPSRSSETRRARSPLPEGETVSRRRVGARHLRDRLATARDRGGGARVCAAGDTHLAFEPRDWDRLVAFVAARSEHMRAARPVGRAPRPIRVACRRQAASPVRTRRETGERLALARGVAAVERARVEPRSRSARASCSSTTTRRCATRSARCSRRSASSSSWSTTPSSAALGMTETAFDALVLDFHAPGMSRSTSSRGPRRDARGTHAARARSLAIAVVARRRRRVRERRRRLRREAVPRARARRAHLRPPPSRAPRAARLSRADRTAARDRAEEEAASP